MSHVIFMDSFEDYPTSSPYSYVIKKWTEANSLIAIGTAYGRTGKGAGSQFGPLRKTFPTGMATMVGGMAYKTTQFTGSPITLDAMSGNQVYCNAVLSHVGDGRLQMYCNYGGAKYGDPLNFVMHSGTWYFIELKGTFSSSGFTYWVRVNEAYINPGGAGGDSMTYTTSIPVGYPSIPDRFSLGQAAASACVDDVYIADDDFKRDIKISRYRTNGDYAVTFDESDPTKANWELVHDDTPDMDATYVYKAASPFADIYEMEDMPVDVEIVAVQLNLWCEKDDSGTCSAEHVWTDGATEVVGTTFYPSALNYICFHDTRDTHPTGVPWTRTLFNAIKTGIRRLT